MSWWPWCWPSCMPPFTACMSASLLYMAWHSKVQLGTCWQLLTVSTHERAHGMSALCTRFLPSSIICWHQARGPMHWLHAGLATNLQCSVYMLDEWSYLQHRRCAT